MTTNGKTDGLPENEQPPRPDMSDVAAEFAEVGRKLRDALNTAWNSQERVKLEGDIREGLNRLTEEVNEATKNMRESNAAQKVEESAKQVKEDVESGKVTDDMRNGLVKALRSLSEALDKMAGSFTPAEGEDTPKK